MDAGDWAELVERVVPHMLLSVQSVFVNLRQNFNDNYHSVITVKKLTTDLMIPLASSPCGRGRVGGIILLYTPLLDWPSPSREV